MTDFRQRAPLRIGYLNQDFPPEVGACPARILELARHWQDAGAEVTVITGMPNRRLPGGPDGTIPEKYRGRFFMEERWEGVRVLRSWLYASTHRSVLRTALNNGSFMATAAAHALMRSGRLDLIIASSPPFLTHLTGDLLRVVRRIPMVLEIRDLWPDYMVQMGVVQNGFGRRILFGLERYLLSRANRVVVVTDSFKRRVAEKGVSEDRIDIIPNAVNLDQYYRDVHSDPPLPELIRRDGELIVGYLGNFGAGQELRTIVEAAAELAGRAPDIRFVLAGDGTEKSLVERRAAQLELPNLSIHPPVPKVRTRAFYNACDLCLVPLAAVPIFSETVPSKLFEIMACERPVLGSVAGEAARVIRESRGGIVVPPGSAAAIADGLIELKRLTSEERRTMGRAGRAFVERHYRRDLVAKRYLRILAGLV